MEKAFVDTNIFIYSLFNVDEKKHRDCINLFEMAGEGGVNLWTTEWVIAELVWFLMRQKTGWAKIKEIILLGVFTTKGLEVREKKWLIEVLEKCESGKDFVDAVNISLILSSGIKKVYSYDKMLQKWTGIKRLEP